MGRGRPVRQAKAGEVDFYCWPGHKLGHRFARFRPKIRSYGDGRYRWPDEFSLHSMVLKWSLVHEILLRTAPPADADGWWMDWHGPPTERFCDCERDFHVGEGEV